MAAQYIGEIRMLAGAAVPSGWALCNGQTLSTSDYPQLFALIGHRYGGDGATFALPDMRGRIPVHRGRSHTLGEAGGEEAVALDVASAAGRLGEVKLQRATNGGGSSVAVAAVVAESAMPLHNNMQPFLCVNFIMAVEGQIPEKE